MKTKPLLLLAAFGLCLPALHCPAQPAYVLDPDFKPVIQQPIEYWQLRAAAMQADGKIVVSGPFKLVDGVPLPGLARLNPDGTVDESFHPPADWNESWLSLYSDDLTSPGIAIQPDQRILVFEAREVPQDGHFWESGFRLIRLNSDGSRDSAFFSSPLFNWRSMETASRITALPDGQVFIPFSFPGDSFTESASGSIRLKADGSPDPDFKPAVEGELLAVQLDGRTIVSVQSEQAPDTSRVVRLNADGSLDSSFAPPAGATNVWTALAQADGKIVIAGDFDTIDGQSRNGLARLHSDGKLDLTFNPPSLTPWPQWRGPQTVAQRPDGRLILLTKEYRDGEVSLLHVYSLLLDGTVENHSQAPGSWSDSESGINSLHFLRAPLIGFLPDGGFILRMAAIKDDLGGPRFLRIAPDGTIDESFFNHLGSEPYIGAIARQPDGKILVRSECCSIISVNGRFAGRLARLNPDGTLDDAYMARLPIETQLPDPDDGMVLQPDGKVLTIGAGVIRLNDDGTLDTSFVATRVSESHAYVRRLYRQGARGVLAVVWWFGGQNRPPELWRIRQSGGWDEAFRVVLSNWQPEPQSLTVDAEDRILVSGGFTAWTGHPRQGIARLLADGSLDQSFNPQFGLAGRVTTWGTSQQPDGRILVRVQPDGGGSLFKRLLADGSVDASFTSQLWVSPQFMGAMDGSVFTLGPGGYADNFAFEPDGSLLVAGHFSSINGQTRLGLARLKPAPVWRSSSFDATGRFTGTIGCLTGWNYRVEASADLKQWDAVATGTSAGESVPFADTAPPGTGRRFYRVVKE